MGLHDFTSKEVLNKVYRAADSGTVGIQHFTLQEALNAVLNEDEETLNVSLENFPKDTVSTEDDSETAIQAISTESDSVITIEVDLIGVQSNGSNTLHTKRIATYKNDGGTLTEVGTSTNLHSEIPAGWGGLSISIQSTNIKLGVTGVAGTDIYWQVQTMINQVTYSS